MNQDQTFHNIHSQIITNKKYKTRNNQLIQPWMDQPHSIPLYLLKTQSQKYQQKTLKIRKHVSMELNSKNSLILSPKKQMRPSKQLPKKNIGNFTIIKINQQRNKSKELVKKRRTSQTLLPTLSVTRELAIERKLYLMSHKNQINIQKPRRSLRNIVDSRVKINK